MLPIFHTMTRTSFSSSIGCPKLVPVDCTPRLSINFLGPILLIFSSSLKAISLVTSAWINLFPSCPHIPPILRPCRPPSSNLEHLNALKLRLLRFHANLLHVVLLSLQLHRIPCHPTSHSVTTTFPSFSDIEITVPDPSPPSRTPRRDTDLLFTALMPENHPLWVLQAPPAPASDPFLSMDVRDFNPIDPDIAKGKGKGKSTPADKGSGKSKKRTRQKTRQT